MPQEVTLTTEEKVLVSLQPLTEAGNPAVVDGPATFTVVSGTCTIAPVDDLSAYVVSGSDAGDSQVSMAVDADVGAGVTHISDTVLVHVTAALAEQLQVTLGSPELK
jgi:hypothetical protein